MNFGTNMSTSFSPTNASSTTTVPLPITIGGR
jgi:hypothetical protein